MITRYLKTVTATFNPMSGTSAHKLPRIFLSFLGSDARTASGGGLTIKANVLPNRPGQVSMLALSFKDGKEMRWVQHKMESPQYSQDESVWNLSQVRMRDIEEEVDRHSRVLKRKEDLAG